MDECTCVHALGRYYDVEFLGKAQCSYVCTQISTEDDRAGNAIIALFESLSLWKRCFVQEWRPQV